MKNLDKILTAEPTIFDTPELTNKSKHKTSPSKSHRNFWAINNEIFKEYCGSHNPLFLV